MSLVFRWSSFFIVLSLLIASSCTLDLGEDVTPDTDKSDDIDDGLLTDKVWVLDEISATLNSFEDGCLNEVDGTATMKISGDKMTYEHNDVTTTVTILSVAGSSIGNFGDVLEPGVDPLERRDGIKYVFSLDGVLFADTECVTHWDEGEEDIFSYQLSIGNKGKGMRIHGYPESQSIDNIRDIVQYIFELQ